jgi:hypothetical protein
MASPFTLFVRFWPVLIVVATAPAWAGPPYVTDDPEPTDCHKWEIYNYVDETRADGITAADFGLDLNYGAFKDVQLTTTLPLHSESGAGVTVGDVELAVKYKFVHQDPHGLAPDIAIFPRVFLPTAPGSRHAQFLLPIWLEKDVGATSVFGGGGYVINPGRGNRDYALWGAVLAQQVRPGFQLGVEYAGQGRSGSDVPALHVLNLGAVIHIKGPYSVLGSFGQGVNRKQTIFYTALKLDL